MQVSTPPSASTLSAGTSSASSASSSASASGAASSASVSSQAPAINSDFDTFLKMLTTQMKNQDPLKPIDSADYAVQLATFSGVEQQTKTNQLLDGLTAQMSVLGMSQMASWVGMEARAATPAQFSGTPLTLAPNPLVQADRTVLVVKDADGNEVSRADVPVSSQQIQWDGTDANGKTLPDGLYSFELENYGNGGLLATDQVEVYSKIREARGSANGTMLVLDGGIQITTGQITALRQPTS